MTIRDELKLLEPERVRAGMVAFEHRVPGYECATGWCCFMTHAMNSTILLARERMGITNVMGEATIAEAAFEGWQKGVRFTPPDVVSVGGTPEQEFRKNPCV